MKKNSLAIILTSCIFLGFLGCQSSLNDPILSAEELTELRTVPENKLYNDLQAPEKAKAKKLMSKAVQDLSSDEFINMACSQFKNTKKCVYRAKKDAEQIKDLSDKDYAKFFGVFEPIVFIGALALNKKLASLDLLYKDLSSPDNLRRQTEAKSQIAKEFNVDQEILKKIELLSQELLKRYG